MKVIRSDMRKGKREWRIRGREKWEIQWLNGSPRVSGSRDSTSRTGQIRVKERQDCIKPGCGYVEQKWTEQNKTEQRSYEGQQGKFHGEKQRNWRMSGCRLGSHGHSCRGLLVWLFCRSCEHRNLVPVCNIKLWRHNKIRGEGNTPLSEVSQQ